jgi:uncharacterized protein with PIN domain
MRKCNLCNQDVCTDKKHELTTYDNGSETIERFYLCQDCSSGILAEEAWYSMHRYFEKLSGETHEN